MTDNNISNELIYKTLQNVQKTIADMDTRVTNSIHILSGKVSAMDSHMAGFHSTMTTQNDQLDQHTGRIEALENTIKGDDPTP